MGVIGRDLDLAPLVELEGVGDSQWKKFVWKCGYMFSYGLRPLGWHIKEVRWQALHIRHVSSEPRFSLAEVPIYLLELERVGDSQWKKLVWRCGSCSATGCGRWGGNIKEVCWQALHERHVS